jgi:hypothetical protein
MVMITKVTVIINLYIKELKTIYFLYITKVIYKNKYFKCIVGINNLI